MIRARRVGALLCRLMAGLIGATTALSCAAADFDYQLAPERIADGVYVLVGRTEDFSFDNGGNIVNTSFIVGDSGVTVIDTGSSKRYGEQLRAAIASITPLPIALVINTHHHPDHFLGNQGFATARLAATPTTALGIETEGPAFLDNMYRLNGDWMLGTEVVVPRAALEPARIDSGGRTLEILTFDGHTASDLVVRDPRTGTLFASDLVFNGRAPTTPHADIATWLEALDRLQQIPFTRLVPGHGAIASDTRPIEQTRRYLQWLSRTIAEGAEQGLDMTEMLEKPVPAEFAGLAVVDKEYRRSVVHLFPQAELAALRAAATH